MGLYSVAEHKFHIADRIPSHTDLPEVIQQDIEADGDTKITDLHIWQVGEEKFAAIVGVVAHKPDSPDDYQARLKNHDELVHVTIEVQRCHEHELVHA